MTWGHNVTENTTTTCQTACDREECSRVWMVPLNKCQGSLGLLLNCTGYDIHCWGELLICFECGCHLLIFFGLLKSQCLNAKKKSDNKIVSSFNLGKAFEHFFRWSRDTETHKNYHKKQVTFLPLKKCAVQHRRMKAHLYKFDVIHHKFSNGAVFLISYFYKCDLRFKHNPT